MWVALHNLRAEPVNLYEGYQVGTTEAAEIVEPAEVTADSAPMPRGGLVPKHLSPVQ